MKTFADAEVALARSLPGYESRVPQQTLAREVEAVFGNSDNFKTYNVAPEEYGTWSRPGVSHLLGQAGCGTGKSLAYIIPAVLSGRRVVVSVTTKALQDQIVSTDLPFLTEHLGVDFTYALLKGRSNYLCLNRLQVISPGDVGGNQGEVVEALRVLWEKTQDPTFDGLRESVGHDVPDRLWSMAASESEDCSSNKCATKDCYAAKARQVAAESQIVVANHSLFFTDLVMKSRGLEGMLGQYELVIFDEAHTMEEVAGNTLGATISEGTFASLGNQVKNWATEHADDDETFSQPLLDMNVAAHALYQVLTPGRLRTAALNEIVDEIGTLYEAVDSVRAALSKATYEGAKDPQKAGKRRWTLNRQTYNLLDRLGEVIAAPSTEIVRWVEEESRKGGPVKVIKTAPILVSPFLEKWLFSKSPTVLVSATLAVKGSMAYAAGRLGIKEYSQIDVGTPFDFGLQGRLYVPVIQPNGQAFPAPDRNNIASWEILALQEIHRLVTISKGRALILFTSVKQMRSTFETIKQMDGDLTYRMQGERGSTNRDLVDWLKDHESGGPGRVLFGTKSFFTGIDIPGDALSLLVITKMPFPVPTEPLTEARCEAIELAGGSSFSDYTIPVMSLELQQGIGRLIRHRGDSGVAAILDPRLVNKGYGKQILRDLPPMGQTFSLNEVQTFFDQRLARA